MSGMKAVASAAGLASLAFVAGCAGNQAVPAASIQQAEQRIEEAERADAQRYATRELNMAREKLLQAREAQEEGDEEIAAQLAEHAELDAAYAIALADNEAVQSAADELRATLSTLESELERQGGPAPAGDTGVSSEDGDIDVSLRDDELELGNDRPELGDEQLELGEPELGDDQLDLGNDELDAVPSNEPGVRDPLGPDPRSETEDDAAPEL